MIAATYIAVIALLAAVGHAVASGAGRAVAAAFTARVFDQAAIQYPVAAQTGCVVATAHVACVKDIAGTDCVEFRTYTRILEATACSCGVTVPVHGVR